MHLFALPQRAEENGLAASNGAKAVATGQSETGQCCNGMNGASWSLAVSNWPLTSTGLASILPFSRAAHDMCSLRRGEGGWACDAKASLLTEGGTGADGGYGLGTGRIQACYPSFKATIASSIGCRGVGSPPSRNLSAMPAVSPSLSLASRRGSWTASFISSDSSWSSWPSCRSSVFDRNSPCQCLEQTSSSLP